MSDVEYEMTSPGRTSLLLMQHGILSADIEKIEPRRFATTRVWHVKVVCRGSSEALMTIGSALKLVALLRAVGARDLADRVERGMDRTRGFQQAGHA